MKRFLLAIVVACSATMCFAQTGARSGALIAYNAAGTVKQSGDTTTNTDTTYLSNGKSDNDQWDVQFVVVNANITGTTTMSMIVQGSDDATTITNGTWRTLKTDQTMTYGLTDTGTVAGTTYTFIYPKCQYRKLRVRIITGGTQTSRATGTYYLKANYITGLN